MSMSEVTPKSLVNTSIAAGWVRAGVGAGMTILISKVPWIAPYVGDTVQDALSVVISTAAVGFWQQYVKKYPPRA